MPLTADFIMIYGPIDLAQPITINVDLFNFFIDLVTLFDCLAEHFKNWPIYTTNNLLCGKVLIILLELVLNLYKKDRLVYEAMQTPQKEQY